MDRSTNYANQGWRCPDCGKINNAGSGFCTGCGRRMPSPQEAAPGAFAGQNMGYDQGGYGSYQDPRNTGYVDPRNTGYVDPRNTGYVDPRNTGYYDPRDTGYYDPVDYDRGGGGGNGGSSGGALKIIAIVLVCLLVAVAIGFGVSRILLNRSGGPGTEQGQPGVDPGVDPGTDPGVDPGTDPGNDPGSTEEPPEDPEEEDAYFKVGKAYKVVVHEGVRVRKGPSKDYEQVKRKNLSSEYYDQSLKGDLACLKQGATVYCISMEGDWMEISDGWVCVRDGGEDLIK